MTIALPPLVITQGLDFFQEYRLLDGPVSDETPVADWEGHTASVRIAANDAATSIYSGAASIHPGGYLTVSLPRETTSALEFENGRLVGILQITITDPGSTPAFIWQAPLRIARSIK